ncbi:KICSTOR complex protein SZT2-like [Oppia nitens]|uniref:KICSTOR complex protein SZT2-like n=1 Tax=Oppia nitens TaxID=1686743 RepID=UPI0023DCC61A|nr:KICSTOR complex protein SZT2-like [Oppia nitens]
MTTNKMVKEADTVFVVMTDKYRISRNTRANWYFDRIHTHVTINDSQTPQSLNDCNNEIDIVSIVAANYLDSNHSDSESQYLGQYFISTATKVTFLSRRYCFAYVLDLSPSMSSVDIQRSRILMADIFTSMATSLRGLVQPFYIPGSKLLFKPDLFISIVAYIPFYDCDRHQVLSQGWKVTVETIEEFLSYILSKLSQLVAHISEIMAKYRDYEDQCEPEVMIGALFDENDNKSKYSATLLATPDISMVNMLRFGLLALQLLPDNSSTGIVIVSDGMFSLPNETTLESALTQLRHHTISCSFIQTCSSSYPYSSLGFIPYTDLMKFIATATFGAYFTCCPQSLPTHSDVNNEEIYEFNLYHRSFFAWNFQRGLFGFKADINSKSDENLTEVWHFDNPYFYSILDFGLNSNRQTRDQQIVRNKQIENTVSAQLTQVVSSRLREGYTIKSVNYNPSDDLMEVRLLLPWRHNVNILYNVSSTFNPKSVSDSEEIVPECHYEVIVEGSYNFLHDVTCAARKPIKSAYRSATIRQFWTTIKNLSDSDKHEIDLYNFTRNAWSRSIPESIKNGVPLFYMPPNSSDVVVSSKNIVHSQFAQYWKWMLDMDACAKWMHTHRINIILEHDLPLPKHLQLPNTSGRFTNIQCRQSLSSLNTLLTENSSFVLLENQSYVKLIQSSSNDNPHSFYLIRVIAQPPCVIIHLSFIGGTSGHLRCEILNELKELIKCCKFPKRHISSFNTQKSKMSQLNDLNEMNEYNKSERKFSFSYQQRHSIDDKCCVLITKPIDKILIRYERLPKNFNYILDKYWISKNNINLSNTSHNQSLTSLNMFQILSRYLDHQRWIWTPIMASNTRLSSSSFAKILIILTKIRLQQGFHFAHSDSGILNLIQEIPIKDQNNCQFSCLIQYIIFPTQTTNESKDSLSDDEKYIASESNSDAQLITECWVEPQNGITFNCNHRNKFLDGLNYKEILQSFYAIDLETISCLLTFEQTFILCQNNGIEWHNDEMTIQNNESLERLSNETPDTPTGICSPIQSVVKSERIKTVKCCYDIMSLLSKSQQAVVLLSTLFQELRPICGEDNDSVNSSDLSNEQFFDLFILKINSIHDIEIKLNQKDSHSFVSHINQRNESNAYLYKHLIHEYKKAKYNVKFRCFAKKLNNNSILITIIPATFGDLKLLIFGDEMPPKESLNVFHEINDSTNNEESFYGSLSLAIFIYRTCFSDLSEQLVYMSNNGKHCKDLYFDNTYKSQKNNSSHYPFKLLKGNDNEVDNKSKSILSIKQFCRNLQTIYWNCMTESLNKSLQFGYLVDKKDYLIEVPDTSSDNESQKQFTEAVKRAAIDCRRELLWACLLPREIAGKDIEELTLNDFEELLSLVDKITLRQYDPKLTPFTEHDISWFQSLAKTLVYKKRLFHKSFTSSDLTSNKLVFSLNSCLDCFILLDINLNASEAEICLVFKKQMTDEERQTFIDSNIECHNLVEEFVNACAYHMWSTIT